MIWLLPLLGAAIGGAIGQAEGGNTRSTLRGAGIGGAAGMTAGAGASALGAGAAGAGGAGAPATGAAMGSNLGMLGSGSNLGLMAGETLGTMGATGSNLGMMGAGTGLTSSGAASAGGLGTFFNSPMGTAMMQSLASGIDNSLLGNQRQGQPAPAVTVGGKALVQIPSVYKRNYSPFRSMLGRG